MPIYEFKHPKTGEVFEEIRLMKDRDKPFISADGETCERIFFSSMGYMGRCEKERECFELDPHYCKKISPKFIKYRDNHRERYDPTKHC